MKHFLPVTIFIYSLASFLFYSSRVFAQQHKQPSATVASTPPGLFEDLALEEGSQTAVLKAGVNPENLLKENIFIKTLLSTTHCFVEEPVLVRYEVYSAIQSTSEVIGRPSIQNSYTTEITESRPEPEKIYLNGKAYYHYGIYQMQVIPQKAGVFEVQGISVLNKAELQHADNIQVSTTASCVMSSENKLITVKERPPAPASFSGTNGSLKVTVSVSKDSVTLKAWDTLIISIAGTGNIKFAAMPSVQWPPDAIYIEPLISESFRTDSFPIYSNKIFRIPFYVTKNGLLKIAIPEYVFFDYLQGKYLTAAPSEVAVNAVGSMAYTEQIAKTTSGVKTNQNLPVWKWSLSALCLLLVAGLLINKRVRKNKNVPPAEKEKSSYNIGSSTLNASLDVNKPGSVVPTLLPDPSAPDFFQRSRVLIINLLQQKLQTSTSDEADLKAQIGFQTNGKQLQEELTAIFRFIDKERYAPVIDEATNNSYKQLIQNFIKELTLNP